MLRLPPLNHGYRDRIAGAGHAVLWVCVAAYAALVVRRFFHLSGSAVYLSTDDGLANIAYALATEGRYGFLSSPVLLDMARDQGLFSYGPYYFFLGAALIWLFGYSLTVLRSIHLGVILVVAIAARGWLGRAASGAAAAIVAIGVLEAFDHAQWPMVRPDSMVSLFAVALVICAGLAIRTGRARYWVGAGLSAACGAFTHLVAWSLIPSVVAMLGVAGWLGDDKGPSALLGTGRRLAALRRGALAVAVGGVIGAVTFYASFGFRLRDQLEFLRGYQALTGSGAAMPAIGTAYTEVLLRHFDQAYWYLPWPLGKVVWATLFFGGALALALLAKPGPALSVVEGPRRRDALALLAPPLIVWAFYLLSLGAYNNFHTGYAILSQVMWLWSLGAVGTVLLMLLDPWPALRQVSAVLGWIVAMGLAVAVLSGLSQRTPYRALADAASVPIEQYVDRVLAPLPARARAWGSVAFGIEHPGRIQLIQFDEAARAIDPLPADDRMSLAPDDLVWGFGENLINTVTVTGGAGGLSGTLTRLLPAVRYSLVSLTAAAPYGVTRVYTRSDAAMPAPIPSVSVYEPRLRRWNSSTGPFVSVATTAAQPARMHVGQDAGAPVRNATQTIAGELPDGLYLIRVTMAAGSAAEGAVLVASGAPEIRDAFGQFGPDFDVSPWLTGEGAVHLIHRHAGGPLYVSQFGPAPAAMAAIEASRLWSVPDHAIARRGKVPEIKIAAHEWVAARPDVQVTSNGDAATVVGNRTQFDYEAYGPRIAVKPGQRMMLRLTVEVSEGTACLGVLDEAGAKWVVVPDKLEPLYEFEITDSRTVRPVLADCSASPAGIVPIRATIGDGAYAAWSDDEELYVDMLMRARANAGHR